MFSVHKFPKVLFADDLHIFSLVQRPTVLVVIINGVLVDNCPFGTTDTLSRDFLSPQDISQEFL